MAMNPNLLTIKQAAAKYSVDQQTIVRKLKEGRFAANKFGRQWRIDRKSLDAYFRSYSNLQPR